VLGRNQAGPLLRSSPGCAAGGLVEVVASGGGDGVGGGSEVGGKERERGGWGTGGGPGGVKKLDKWAP
jgi:hypothetical protein